jgi:hypothetical protein
LYEFLLEKNQDDTLTLWSSNAEVEKRTGIWNWSFGASRRHQPTEQAVAVRHRFCGQADHSSGLQLADLVARPGFEHFASRPRESGIRRA